MIERLAGDLGEDMASNKQALALFQTALLSRIYWEARTTSFDSAGELLNAYHSRFAWITDWNPMKREQYLGGFHNYASDHQLRRRWRNVWDARWNEHYFFLKKFADTDPDFGLRLAIEFSEINRRNNAIAAPHEQELVRAAVQLKPALLKTDRATLQALVQWWLQFEQEDDSYARKLVREHFFTELRPWLVANLRVKTKRLGPPEPDYPWRQNCLALLADRSDLDAVGNPWTYIQDNAPVFLRASETVTWGDGTKRTVVFFSQAQMREVLQQPIPQNDRTALAEWLDARLADITDGKGAWANNDDSRSMALAMKAALLSR